MLLSTLGEPTVRIEYEQGTEIDIDYGILVIHKYAGRDASEAYNEIHAPSLVSTELGDSKRIGEFDTNSLGAMELRDSLSQKNAEPSRGRRSLHTIMSTYDFEEAAKENLSPKAWAFFSSAATDLVTMQANIALFQRIWLRPQIMRDVKVISTRANMLGVDMSLPLFACPTALAKLAHPNGEVVIAEGCSVSGTPQVVSYNITSLIIQCTHIIWIIGINECLIFYSRYYSCRKYSFLLPTLCEQRSFCI